MMRLLICLMMTICLAPPVAAALWEAPIRNAGFEEITQTDMAPGWGWYARQADVSFVSTTDSPHEGKRCLVFRNRSGMAPEVYGRLYQNVAVHANTRYELTVWVRARGAAEGIHWTDWGAYTMNLPMGSYDWRRVSTRFTTAAGQTVLNLGLNVTNRCDELAIDSISLRPVGMEFRGKGIEASLIAPGQVTGDNQTAHLGLFVHSSLPVGARIDIRIRSGSVDVWKHTQPLEPGDHSHQWEWNTGKEPRRRMECSVRLIDASGREAAACTTAIEKLSPVVLLDELKDVQSLLPVFDGLAARCRARSIPVDYPVVARTLVQQFLPLTHKDIADGQLSRAGYAVKDLRRALEQAIQQMRAWLQDPTLAPIARRYRTGPVSISGLSLVGNRQDARGRVDSGPLFFCGYGHFGQVRRDMHRWPAYGVNIIQFSEFGPASVFPAEGVVDLTPVHTLLHALDEAARYHVRVDFLISPHYYPQWHLDKHPELMQGGGGFLGFTVDAPEARELIERYLRLVIPMIRNHPALNSVCLSNEPLFDRGAAAHNTPALWTDWLRRTHGDVDTLNRRYGAGYTAFDDVPIPPNHAADAPAFYDWCVFNQERFAGWHRWMADVIREMAPELPIHAKLMWIPVEWRQSVAWGIDPELFGALSNLNGNDCTIHPGNDEWAIMWGQQNMFYDLQRSVAHKPIFNSENHLQPDGSTYYVAPEHYRTALWQGAVHGQGATTIWVWERMVPDNPSTHPFLGNVMDRPGCAHAVGVTCLDLNRFAGEVTALQNVRAPVALVYSVASWARHDGYLSALARAYTALNFCGVKVDFLTERQLEAGQGGMYRVVVLPEVTHTPDSALEALERLPASVRLVMIGDCLTNDPYRTARPDSRLERIRQRALQLPGDAQPQRDLWPALLGALRAAGVLPQMGVVDAVSNRPVWGVEWLPATLDGRTVVNLVNLTPKPVTVRIQLNNHTVRAFDLLSPGGRETVRTLQPIVPVLAEVKP